MKHFLLIYDAIHGVLDSIREFDDELVALEEFTREERQHFRDSRVRVVLLSGDSREAIEQTHGNFFQVPRAHVA